MKPPRTPAQIEASRRNGAKSRGPLTPEGKRRTARDDQSHRYLAHTVVLDGESTARFQTLLASLFAEHQPRTPTEIGLVESMTVNRWRQMRVWGLEKAGLTRELHKQQESPDGIETDPPTRTMSALLSMNQEDRAHDLLIRYNDRFSRAHDRALWSLNRLRAERRAAGELPFPQSTLEEK